MPTIQELEVQAESFRQSDQREKFLEVRKQIENKKYEAVLANHQQRLDAASKEFPVGKYIPEIRATVKEIKHGCGTQRGWISIYLSGQESGMDISDLRRKIRLANEERAARAYFDGLKFSDRKHSLYIGPAYEETLSFLIKRMDLDLPVWNDLDYFDTGEIYRHAIDKAVEDGYSDEKAEEKAKQAEDDFRDEEYKKWKSAIESTLNYLLGFHHLELLTIKKKYYIKAQSWHKAADEVASTISGYGTFEYKNGQELKDTGPYKSFCEAIMQHLHWMKYYPEIYGDTGYSRYYKRRF